LPANLDTTYEQFLSIGVNLNNFPLNALPILSAEQVQQINSNIATASGRTFNPLSGLQLVTAGDDLKSPRSVQFGVAVEREIASGLTVGANFDYVNTVNLNRNRDYDLPVPRLRAGDLSQRPYFGLGSTAGNNPPTRPGDAQQRPITQLGNSGYVQVREASARSLFRGLTLRAQLRRRFGQFDAFYVFSKNLDDDSTERNATFSEYDNSFDLQPEYNFSRLDRRHQFVFNTVLNAPLGFEVATTGRLLSSLPIDVSVSGIVAPNDFVTIAPSADRNGAYAAAVTVIQTSQRTLSDGRTYLVGNTTGDLNQDLGNFSDRPYTAPGVSLLRNANRNTPFYNVDIRIQRPLRFGGERYALTPSFEVFNVFKFDNIQLAGTTATNYGNPGINERTGEVLQPSNPDFLRIRNASGSYLLNNNAGAPLQIQLGVRLAF
ncbi:MAG: hypothetical protein H0T92_13770, partial [Pyrinomonadaceae bacterium]|nr:hypothetical protein [Pyrinomonadaceae bacterium]